MQKASSTDAPQAPSDGLKFSLPIDPDLVRKGYSGTATPDHMPRFTKKAGRAPALAYAIGYMRALYQRAREEVAG